MKVNGEVRNYIEKKVRKSFASQYAPIDAEIKKEQKRWNDLQDVLKQKLVSIILAEYDDDNAPAQAEFSVFCADGYRRYWQPQVISDLNDKRYAINEKVNEVVDDICLELSLGGTKADIEKLLDQYCPKEEE